jgi:acetyltransferase-like isoleucine patch superfamily enzyme
MRFGGIYDRPIGIMKFNNKNVQIENHVKIGKSVKIGDNSVIYDYCYIDDNSIIANDCVIGEPSTDYYYSQNYLNRHTTIGKNVLIRSHAIIYNGNNIGDHVSTGHRIMLRENNIIGESCRIGNYTELHGNVKLGRFVRLHSSVCVVENSVIGDYVWISPGTILTNDITPPSNNVASPIIGDYSFIAVNCIILPGLEIGKHCLIGAGTLVSKNIPDYSVVFGNPGKIVCDVREYDNKGYKHYPWPFHFDRGMPWEGIGYKKWQDQQASPSESSKQHLI